MTSGGPDKMTISAGRNRRWIWGCLLVLVFFAAVRAEPVFGEPDQGARGEPVLLVTPSRQLGLADRFFSQFEYHQAVIEYQKFLYFFPEHKKVPYAQYQLAMAYFDGAEYEIALKHFEALARQERQNGFPLEAGFMISRCYVALGNAMSAVANLKKMLNFVTQPDIRDRVHYEIAWIYIGTTPDAECEGVTRALTYFNKIDTSRRADYKIDDLHGALDAVCARSNELSFSRKNPGLAAGLAIFPGAGYAYCGRFHDAVVSFLFNSSLMYAAYEAFDNDHEALGVVVSFVELGFYMGSIYGSTTAAHKHNKYQVDAFLDHLASFRVGIAPVGDDGRLLCSLRVAF
jgi:tetratricopeptide (TPR) repeat protein